MVRIFPLFSFRRFSFQCNKWLALDDKDCTIERYLTELPTEYTSLPTLFIDQSQKQMAVHHLWLSMIFRCDGYQFSSVQKLSCLLALMCLVMISNAMFFKSSNEEKNIQQLKLGVFRFSTSTFFVSVIGILISTPPIIFAVVLFQNAEKRRLIMSSPETFYSKNLNIKEDKLEAGFSKHYREVFRQQKTLLSHCLSFMAWSVIGLSVVSSSFFLILYSMEWGKEKSEEWLSSFFLSFLESVIVVDPVKVFLLTILSLFVMKYFHKEQNFTIDLKTLNLLAINAKVESTDFSAGMFIFLFSFFSGMKE